MELIKQSICVLIALIENTMTRKPRRFVYNLYCEEIQTARLNRLNSSEDRVYIEFHIPTTILIFLLFLETHSYMYM